MPRYSVDDKVYNIPEDKEQAFLAKFPKAKLLSPLKQLEGNEDGTTDQAPTDVLQNTELDSESTLLDSQETSNDFVNETFVLNDNKTDVKDEDKVKGQGEVLTTTIQKNIQQVDITPPENLETFTANFVSKGEQASIDELERIAKLNPAYNKYKFGKAGLFSPKVRITNKETGEKQVFFLNKNKIIDSWRQINEFVLGDKSQLDYDREFDNASKIYKDLKLENESAEDFYKRLTPKTYVEENVSGYSVKDNVPTINRTEVTEVNGIKKYKDLTTNKITYSDPKRREEYQLLNYYYDLKSQANDLRAKLAGEYEELSDAGIMQQFYSADPSRSEKADVGDYGDLTQSFVDDKEFVDTYSYIDHEVYVEDVKVNQFLEEFASKQSAWQSQYEQEFLSEFESQRTGENGATTSFSKEREKLLNEAFGKQLNTFNSAIKTETDIIIQEQKYLLSTEVDAGLWSDFSQDQLNDKLNERINIIRDSFIDNIEKSPEYQKFFDSYDKKSQEIVGDLMKDFNNKKFEELEQIKQSEFKKFSQDFDPNNIVFDKVDKDVLDDIARDLDITHGFADLSYVEQKDLINKYWQELESKLRTEDGVVDSEEVQDMKKDYYGYFYQKLSQTVDQNDQTNFVRKDIVNQIYEVTKIEVDRLIDEAVDSGEIKYLDKSIGMYVGYSNKEEERRAAMRYVIEKNPELATSLNIASEILNAPSPEELKNNPEILNWWKGVSGGKLHEIIPFLSGVIDLNDTKTMYDISKTPADKRTKAQELYVTLKSVQGQHEEALNKVSKNYKAGVMTRQSMPFMFEMGLTGGAYSFAKKGVEVAVKKSLLGTAKSRFKKGTSDLLFVKKNAKYKLVDNAAETMGVITGSLTQTLANPQRYLNNMYQNLTPQMAYMMTSDADGILDELGLGITTYTPKDGEAKDTSVLKAFTRGVGISWGDYSTERLGLYMGKGFNRLSAPVNSAWSKAVNNNDFLRRLTGSWILTKYKTPQAWLQRNIGIDGFFGEFAEELVNIPYSNLVMGDITMNGIYKYDQLGRNLGLDYDNLDVIARSVAGGQLIFKGGGFALHSGYSLTTRNKNPLLKIDGIKFNDEQDFNSYLLSLSENGLLNEDTDIVVKNDFETVDNAVEVLKENGLSEDQIDTGASSLGSGSAITASEVEILNEIQDNDVEGMSAADIREENENLEKQIVETRSQIEFSKQSELPSEERNKAKKSLKDKLKDLVSKQNNLLDKAKKRANVKKREPFYQQALNTIRKIKPSDTTIREFKDGQELGNYVVKSAFGVSRSEDFEGNVTYTKDSNGEVINDEQTIQFIEGKYQEAAQSGQGAFVNESNEIIINKQKALESGNVNVAAHEFLHRLLKNTLENSPELRIAFGSALHYHLKTLNPKQIKDASFRARLAAYNNKSKADQMEEVLNLTSDALANGTMTFDASFMQKLSDMIRRIMQSMGVQISFEKPEDVFNFIRDYNESILKGDLTASQKSLLSEETIQTEGVMGQFVSDQKKEVEDIMKKTGLTKEQVDSQLRFSKEEASAKVQDIYEKQGEAGAFEIFEAFKPITARLVRKYENVPGFDAEQLTSEIEIGKRGMYDLIRDYDLESGVPLAAYINKFLPARAIEAANRVLKTEFEEDVTEARGVAADEASEITVSESGRKTKLKVLADDLGISESVSNEVSSANIDKAALTNFKSVPNGATNSIAEAMGISPKKILTKANLTRSEVDAAQRFINKHADSIISALPEGFDSADKATGVPKTILKQFYNQRSARAKTKAGLKVQIKNPNLKTSEFLDYFGIVKGQPNKFDRNLSAKLIALANVLDKVATNQALRQRNPELANIANGMSKVMFSKNANAEFSGIKGSWSSMAKDLKYDRLDIKNKADRNDFKEWIKATGSKILPKSFWLETGTILGSGAQNVKVLNKDGDQLYFDKEGKVSTEKKKGSKELREYALEDGRKIRNNDPLYEQLKLLQIPNKSKGKHAFANVAQANDFFKGTEFKEESDNLKAATTRQAKYKTWDSSQSLEWLKNNQEALNSSEKGFIEIWLAIQADIQQNPQNKRFWAAVLESTSISQEHFSRIGSRFAFTNTLGLSNVEEHTQPASDFAATLFAMADMGVLDESTISVAVSNSYLQGALPKIYDDLLKGDGFSYVSKIPAEHQKDVFFGITPVWIRYINPEVNRMKHTIDGVEYKGINPNVILLSEGQTLAEEYGLEVDKSLHKEQDVISYQQEMMFQVFAGNLSQAKATNNLQEYTSKYKLSKDESIANTTSRVSDKAAATTQNTPTVGMSTFDFDETLIIDGENFIVATNTKTGEKVNISSGNWPLQGPKYAAQGYEFDFTDFVNVRGGVDGPLLQKMKNQIAKYGPKNVFVLTARPQESAVAIHEWLKTKGINIDLANITGLGNSTGDAKAEWMLNKYEQGYNDMYFVDDALPNVDAVSHVFNQLDIKGKSVQAKINFSKDIDSEFNKMLERTKGVGAEKTFSRVEGRKRGKDKGRFTFFVPPSAEDFTGLLRYFAGSGAQGNADIKFFEESLVKPFARAERKMQELRGLIRSEYKALNKKYPKTKKALGKRLGSTGFTLDQAIRIYLYDKAGHEIPGLSENKKKELIKIVKSVPSHLAYADEVGRISRRKEGYVKPDEFWDASTIAADFDGLMKGVTRKEFLQEFIQNSEIVFSAKNLNKIEAVYGSQFRNSLEDVLYRMKSGVNRSANKSYGQAWTNWVNGSVGAIMFFNARSAVLQTLSTVNFINFEDNNIFAAGKALANQKQYWSDFSMLFNSDFLKNRRAGLATNVNEAELANAVATASNKAKAALSYLLKIGFTPTQIADSFAIASGGATFYRNRVGRYLKEGMSQAEAESQAMLDFQEIAEETQQSARPDRISQQQASPLGRLILAFANTPMQYNRLIKKAAGDLINGRGDWRSNMSRILYYGAAQNFIFASLQNALFAVAFGEEEEDEKREIKEQRILNSMFDSLARGSGVYGAALATLKNTYLRYIEEDKKGFRADYGQVLVEALNVSPPMGSKARKLYSAFNARKFNREVMSRMDNFDINNPVVPAVANVIEAATNLPLARLDKKMNNIREAMNKDNSNMQRLFLALGWSSWDLNVGKKVIRNKGKENKYTVYLDERRQAVDSVKEDIKEEKKQETVRKKEEKKKQKEKEQEAIVKDNLDKQKEEGKDATCAAVSSKGNRCKRKPIKDGFCTVHEKVEQNEAGKKTQCKKVKSDGKRCKMQTNSKSGFCYYHD